GLCPFDTSLPAFPLLSPGTPLMLSGAMRCSSSSTCRTNCFFSMFPSKKTEFPSYVQRPVFLARRLLGVGAAGRIVFRVALVPRLPVIPAGPGDTWSNPLLQLFDAQFHDVLFHDALHVE